MRPFRVRLVAAVAVLVLAGAAGAGLPTASQRAGGVVGRPAKGKLLVASRQIGDPNFGRSVILLVAYEENGGAMGVIVNRPTPIPLAKVLPQFEALASYRDQVWLGGPVLPTSLMVLQRSAKPPGDAEAVFGDVYVLTSRDSVEGLFGSDKRPGRFRAYAGHAGWGPGQLENEIARGDWIVVAAKPEVVFSEEPAGVWERLMESSEGEWTLLEPPAPGGQSAPTGGMALGRTIARRPHRAPRAAAPLRWNPAIGAQDRADGTVVPWSALDRQTWWDG